MWYRIRYIQQVCHNCETFYHYIHDSDTEENTEENTEESEDSEMNEQPGGIDQTGIVL